MLKRHLLASVGVVALTSVSASAADFKGPAPAAAAPWSWTGFYLGAHAGYGWGRDPFNDAIFGNKIPPLLGINSNGFLGGFHAGANVQNGPWVGGLEIDMSATNIRGSTSSAGFTELAPGITSDIHASQTDKFDWLGSARARFGYLALPNLLLYGTGGLAWTRFTQTQTLVLTLTQQGTAFTASQSATTPTWRFGWVAGAGAETRLWDSNWLARIEYLHYDFRDSGQSISTEEFGANSTSGHLTADVVRAGLSYKFGLGPWAGTAAYAADMPVKAPRVAAAPWSWSGFYLGGHVGYGWGHDSFTEPGSFLALAGVRSTGVVGGIHAGINRQSGAWVGGLEIDLSASTLKGSSSAMESGPDFVDVRTLTDRFEMLGSARARLGYLVWPSVLVYGTGGLAWTRLVQKDDEVDNSAGSISVFSNSNPSWRFGWIAGAGVEARIGNTNWLGRLEYLHYDFGQASSTNYGSSAASTSGHLTTDVVRAGLSYKLDWLTGPAGAGPAMAAAMPVKALPADLWDWSGYYLGGHVGYGWGHDPRSDEFFGDKAPESPVVGDINSKGWLAGFQAGHNWQVKNWVGGLEIDLSASGIKGSATAVIVDGANISIEKDTDQFKLLGSARARLGYLVWPSVLVYGTGGLGWTQLVQKTDFSFNGGLSGSSTPSWHFGWTAGAGVETRLWNTNWLWRLEYLHYDFGDTGSNSSNAVSDIESGGTNFTTGHLTIDAVRTGLSYKFN